MSTMFKHAKIINTLLYLKSHEKLELRLPIIMKITLFRLLNWFSTKKLPVLFAFYKSDLIKIAVASHSRMNN